MPLTGDDRRQQQAIGAAILGDEDARWLGH